MANSTKFWKGMLLGALAGGALSLLDRETRLVMKDHCKNTAKGVSHIIKNPGEITRQVKETALKIRTTVEEVSEDLSYIAGKVEELRETTPEVTKILKETKDAFTKKEEDPDSLELD